MSRLNFLCITLLSMEVAFMSILICGTMIVSWTWMWTVLCWCCIKEPLDGLNLWLSKARDAINLSWPKKHWHGARRLWRIWCWKTCYESWSENFKYFLGAKDCREWVWWGLLWIWADLRMCIFYPVISRSEDTKQKSHWIWLENKWIYWIRSSKEFGVQSKHFFRVIHADLASLMV